MWHIPTLGKCQLLCRCCSIYPSPASFVTFLLPLSSFLCFLFTLFQTKGLSPHWLRSYPQAHSLEKTPQLHQAYEVYVTLVFFLTGSGLGMRSQEMDGGMCVLYHVC